MMKLTLLLCVALFACAHANSIQEKIEATSFSISDTINKAVQQVKDASDKALAKAQEIAKEIKERSVDASQKVFDKVKDIIQKVNTDMNKFVAEAKRRKVDIQECMQLAESIDASALNIVENTSHCVSKKMENGDMYMEAVRAKSNAVLDELSSIRGESEKCMEDVNSFKDSAEAYVCVTKAATRASWAASKRVPTLVSEVGKLTIHLASLPATVPLCTANAVINDFTAQAQRQGREIQQCIRNKIDQQ